MLAVRFGVMPACLDVMMFGVAGVPVGGVRVMRRLLVIARLVMLGGFAMMLCCMLMVFGGSAQFFVTWLIQATGSPIAPVFYVMFGMAVGLVAAFFLVERAHDVRLPALVTVTPIIGGGLKPPMRRSR